MNTNHSSLIRGLNVAITVLAALSLLSCVVAVASMGVAKRYLYDALEQEYYDSSYDYLYEDFYDDWYDYFGDDYWDDEDDHWGDHDYSHPHHTGLAIHGADSAVSASVVPVRGYGYSSGDYAPFVEDYAAADLALSIIDGLLIWEIIVSVVTLLFGILGLIFAGKSAKLRQLMGIGIAGAVVSFLGGHIILVALFIISAVMANKDKTALLNANMAPTVPAPTPSIPTEDHPIES